MLLKSNRFDSLMGPIIGFEKNISLPQTSAVGSAFKKLCQFLVVFRLLLITVICRHTCGCAKKKSHDFMDRLEKHFAFKTCFAQWGGMHGTSLELVSLKAFLSGVFIGCNSDKPIVPWWPGCFFPKNLLQW